MARTQEIDNVLQDRLRDFIRSLQHEKGVKLTNFTSKEISYVYLQMFLRSERTLSAERYTALLNNINRYLDSLK